MKIDASPSKKPVHKRWVLCATPTAHTRLEALLERSVKLYITSGGNHALFGAGLFAFLHRGEYTRAVSVKGVKPFHPVGVAFERGD